MDNDKKFKKDFESGFGALERINFMSDLLSKQNEIRNILDTRASIIIGLNSALLIFLVGEYKNIAANSAYLITALIMLSAVFISVICSILALKPPASKTKKGQEESIFYHHHIDDKPLNGYMAEVHNALESERKIYNEYIKETYNLTVYSNIPRKYYISLAIKALIYGLLLAVGVFLLTIIYIHLIEL